jgi:hypothetical protein
VEEILSRLARLAGMPLDYADMSADDFLAELRALSER